MSEDTPYRHVAFHEAGHAIVGLKSGRTLISIKIAAPPSLAGAVDMGEMDRVNALLNSTDPLSPDDREFLANEARIRLAGLAAEKLEFDQTLPLNSDDLQNANIVLRRLGPGKRGMVLLEDAAQTLNAVRPVLTSLAEMLIVELTPAVDRVIALVNGPVDKSS